MNRRALLRAFLAAPVAVRLAPFLKPAPEYIASAAFTAEKLRSFCLLFNERFARAFDAVPGLNWAAMADAGKLLPGPPR